jgi:hypothetical protein
MRGAYFFTVNIAAVKVNTVVDVFIFFYIVVEKGPKKLR